MYVNTCACCILLHCTNIITGIFTHLRNNFYTSKSIQLIHAAAELNFTNHDTGNERSNTEANNIVQADKDKYIIITISNIFKTYTQLFMYIVLVLCCILLQLLLHSIIALLLRTRHSPKGVTVPKGLTLVSVK